VVVYLTGLPRNYLLLENILLSSTLQPVDLLSCHSVPLYKNWGCVLGIATHLYHRTKQQLNRLSAKINEKTLRFSIDSLFNQTHFTQPVGQITNKTPTTKNLFLCFLKNSESTSEITGATKHTRKVSRGRGCRKPKYLFPGVAFKLILQVSCRWTT
jgi:hypothetical protein